MQYTLGVDIGTFETKAVLVDQNGAIIEQAQKSHKMLVPEPGWAEHRPNEDWWGDFCYVTQSITSHSLLMRVKLWQLRAAQLAPVCCQSTEMVRR